jgi:putative FmdB family regulatory protein
MPIYEYRCDGCGHQFEEFQKITDAPVRTCPECGRRKVRRLISQTSFVLKGDGWYVTDYARKDGGRGGKGAAKEPRKETASKDPSPADKPSAQAHT